MKRELFTLIMACLFTGLINAQTNGTLSVSVTTSSTGGTYSPKNVVAIWIENSSGGFVKTLLAYGEKRKTHLNTWEASTTAAGSAFNVTDAISGATQSSHGTRTCQWDGTDYTGAAVSDGSYKVRMELTDKNATGNVGSFTFSKGPTAQALTPADISSFSAISLNWTPSTTGIDPNITESNTAVVFPNPGKGQFTVLGKNIKSIEVNDLTGKLIYKSAIPVIDLTSQPNGIYFFSIQTDNDTFTRKVIKKNN